jgi:hypothetical protein
MDKFKYYLVLDSGDVEGTNDADVALAACKDGSTIVIDYETGVATFDGETSGIEEADPSDWITPPDDDDDTSDDGVARRKDIEDDE